MKKSRCSTQSNPVSFISYINDSYNDFDDEPLDLESSHISNRGSTEDLYEFLQRDLLLSSRSTSRYSYSSPSRSTCSRSRSSSKLKRNSISTKSRRDSHRIITDTRKERRASLATSFADAIRIEALNGLQKQVKHLLHDIHNEENRWQPPDFLGDIDLNDSHSFLSPKLFHSKKLLDSNILQLKQRKKGPQDIGRVKGFKTPSYAYDILCDKDNDLCFLEQYRSWYPRKKAAGKKRKKSSTRNRSKYSKKTNAAAHNRWNSVKSVNNINSGAIKRKLSTNSLRSFRSNSDDTQYVEGEDGVYTFMMMDFEEEYHAKQKIHKHKRKKKVNRWNNIDFLEEKSHSFCVKKKKRSQTYDSEKHHALKLKLKHSNSEKKEKKRRKSTKIKRSNKTKRKYSANCDGLNLGANEYCLRLSEDEKIKALMEDIDEMDIDINHYTKHHTKKKKVTRSRNKKRKSMKIKKKSKPAPVIPMCNKYKYKTKRKSNIHC